MSSEEEYSDYSGGEEEEEEWTNDHLKLLYLVSNYAKQALQPEDAESWIRKNSLIVLMYEAIVAGVLGPSPAPAKDPSCHLLSPIASCACQLCARQRLLPAASAGA